MTKEDFSITYENNLFHCTKNGVQWISVDGEIWYGEEKRIAELEDKIADIKANCDLAIEGRDVKIKELEQQIEIEKASRIANVSRIYELEQQIEKMKCCANCDFVFRDGNCYYDKECKNKDHWKLRR